MIYLDHAATTPVLNNVFLATIPYFNGNIVGNPSSLHTAGKTVAGAIDVARRQVALLIGADSPDEIIFTSGGTEADNMALVGLTDYFTSAGRRGVIVSAIEHHAVMGMKSVLANLGMPVYILGVDNNGRVDIEQLRKLLQQHSIGIVSVMLVNNEIGTIQDMKNIASVCHEYGALVHTDAVQAIGHMKVNVMELDVDMLSLSGHKVGAPTGIGALYIKECLQKHLSPLIIGGGQEFGLRSGTENVSGIIGLGAAAHFINENLHDLLIKYDELRFALVSGLNTSLPGALVNSHSPFCVNSIVSLTFPDIGGEALLQLMNADGVCMSAASACAAGSLEPSHVLTAIGLSPKDTRETIRVSFGHTTERTDIETAVGLLSKNIKRLRAMYG